MMRKPLFLGHSHGPSWTPEPGFLLLPHPSGRSTWYNKPENREAAMGWMRELRGG